MGRKNAKNVPPFVDVAPPTLVLAVLPHDDNHRTIQIKDASTSGEWRTLIGRSCCRARDRLSASHIKY